MAEQTRERGVPMLVVVFPYFLDLRYDHYLYAPIHAKVAEVAAAAGVPIVDLWPHFAEVDPNGRHWWALPWDAHPSVRAHALAGEIIAKEIEALELLQLEWTQATSAEIPRLEKRPQSGNRLQDELRP